MLCSAGLGAVVQQQGAATASSGGAAGARRSCGRGGRQCICNSCQSAASSSAELARFSSGAGVQLVHGCGRSMQAWLLCQHSHTALSGQRTANI